MARQGMDIDSVTNSGNQMRDVGQSGIPSVISAVEGIVTQIQSAWRGPDADAFVNAWHSTFKPNLTTISEAVATHGQLAVTNAQAQQTASSAGTV